MCLNGRDIATIFLIIASLQISVDFTRAGNQDRTKTLKLNSEISEKTNSSRPRFAMQGSISLNTENVTATPNLPTFQSSALLSTSVTFINSSTNCSTRATTSVPQISKTNSSRLRSAMQGSIFFNTENVTATPNLATFQSSALLSTSVTFTNSSTNHSTRGTGEYGSKKTINNSNKRNLIGFFVFCSTKTAFEVRYRNTTSVCACGEANITFVHCKEKLPLNFTVHISVKNNPNQRTDCLFRFVYKDNIWSPREYFKINGENTSRPYCDELTSFTATPVNYSAFHMEVSSITKSISTISNTSLIGSLLTNTTISIKARNVSLDASYRSSILSDTENAALNISLIRTSGSLTRRLSVNLSMLPSSVTVTPSLEKKTQAVKTSIFMTSSPTWRQNYSNQSTSPNEGKKDKCNDEEEFYTVNKFIKKERKRELFLGFFLNCRGEAVFEVYLNGTLCACDQSSLKFFGCQKKLPLPMNITIFMSKQTGTGSRKFRNRCNFYLVFESPLKTYPGITLPAKNNTGSSVPAAKSKPNSTQPRITSTDSVISAAYDSVDQLFIRSSSVVAHKDLSKVLNPVRFTSPKSILSQRLIPSNTGIVITSATSTPLLKTSRPIEASPIISVTQDSNLVTVSLGISPSSMKNSSIQETASSSFIQATPSTSTVVSTTTLSPDEKKEKKLEEDVEFLERLNTSTVNISDEKTIERALDAAANLINTNLTGLTDDPKKDPGMQAVKTLQDLGSTISRQLDLGNKTSVTYQKVTKDLVFGVAVINATTTPAFSFPSGGSNISDEKIDIPNSVFVPESDPVEMTFEKSNIGQTIEPKCSFLLENNSLSGDYGRWSTRECSVKFENKSHIQCKCSHFTNFAVLFRISDEKISDEDTFRLVIITYIGLGLSILGCLFTFIIYVSLSNIKSDRSTIHTNLVAALGIADVIFLVTVAVKPSGNPCLALSTLAFFFYLAVFFWMLVEGGYIYLMIDVMKVFRGNPVLMRRMAYFVGWGSPIIIVVVTWAVLRDRIVSKYHCWLSVESGAIWAFVGPGLLIILINCFILGVAMKTTWKTFVNDKEFRGLKSATKTFAVVIPVLGITWVFGILAFNESSVVFQYVFAITNSIQGALIFLLYCIVNREVRNELRRKLANWQTRREMSSSSAGGRRRTHDFGYEYPLGEVKVKPGAEETGRRYTFKDPINTSEKEITVKEKNDEWNGKDGRNGVRCSEGQEGKDVVAVNNKAYDESSTAGDFHGL
ncbi:uncharacterized protein LOC114520843 isoform X2 [Dendronephthya gigantea]|uniref:uncharacterized protein LOC114520843 isoform X2 n=1 Tax=Dendronephthya gigantea TaxID=151771 RepID=UPI00106D7C19|nr:uncharacterized protein LOC114520843 isoform X2 [Dendronephthya gigantea]